MGNKRKNSNTANVKLAHEMQAPRFDENGTLIQGAAMADNNAVVEPQTATVDTPVNNVTDITNELIDAHVKTVKGNKYIALLQSEKRATVDDAGTTMFTGNQRSMAIAMVIICDRALGCEFGAAIGNALAARILVHVFGYSLAKGDVLRNGEVAASGMQKYVKYATGDKSRHLQAGGTAYGKLGSKPCTGYYIDSGIAQKLFDRYAPSEGYVASK